MKRALIAVLSALVFTTPALSQSVIASWYGPGFNGHKTASGERFNQNAFTAAHKTLPFGTIVAVTYKGRTIHVRINDRGPYVRGRTLDLSKGASRALGCMATCKVDMAIISRKPTRFASAGRKRTTTTYKPPAKKRTRNLLDFK